MSGAPIGTADDRYDVVVVGSGHGGAMTAATLRGQGFGGSIAIVSEESELPYERPPLSKDYLSGDKPFDRILIRPADYWRDRAVTMLLGRRVEAVDPAAHRVTLGESATVGYGALVWAAGGAPRRLTCAGAEVRGVHSVRNRADVDRMRDEMPHVSHCVVIGGGYIGLEAAAVLTKLGKRVTVLEAQPRLLSRVAGARLGDFIADEHRAHGVDVRLNVAVDCIESQGGMATGVRLADGEVLACEMVIVGIGIAPSVAPLLAAGAAGSNGVDVDAQCRTSLPNIYAVGDCASHLNPFADGAHIRLESVQNAHDQAGVAARAIIGEDVAYHAVPWFWSNQYDLRLQTAGLSTGHDETVLRGDPATRSFSLAYLRAGKLIALDCVNATRDYVAARKLVEAHATPSRAALADPAVELKSLL